MLPRRARGEAAGLTGSVPSRAAPGAGARRPVGVAEGEGRGIFFSSPLESLLPHPARPHLWVDVRKPRTEQVGGEEEEESAVVGPHAGRR